MAFDPTALLTEAAKHADFLKEVYRDAFKPGARQAGIALETTLGLANTLLIPLRLFNASGQKLLQRRLGQYGEEMRDVAPEDVSPVPPEIGVPILEKLSYTIDDQIAELYVTLLSSASSSKTNATAHPSFVNIIANLSPDEAALIQTLSKDTVFPFISARVFENLPATTFVRTHDLLTDLHTNPGIRNPDNLPLYIENFTGLGLLDIDRLTAVARPELYESLESFWRPIVKETIDALSQKSYELRFQRGRIAVTYFGQKFIKACLRSKPKENPPISEKVPRTGT